MIDFEKEGLLEGLDGEAREARLDLLSQLAQDGCTLEELKRAVAEDRLTLLPVERALAGEYLYTPEDVAERSGIPLEFLKRELRALGVPVPEEGEKSLTEEDLEAAVRSKSFLDAGLPEDGILEVARVIGMSMARLAEATQALIGGTYLKAGDNERDVGLRYADMAKLMTPVLGHTMQYVFGKHLRENVKQAVVSGAELEAGELPGSTEITVAFADLVGFTKLGEHLEVAELGDVSGRLVEHATSIVEAPVRLVKMIGDAAMFVSTDSAQVLETALSLVDAVEADESLPSLRAGIARGEALARAGDWYGRPVNLASRITGFARPGTVVVNGGVKEAMAEDAAASGYDFSFAGKRHFKGINGEIAVHRVRRAGGGEQA